MRKVACLLALSSLSILAACGGGGGDVASTPTPPADPSPPPPPPPPGPTPPPTNYDTPEYRASNAATSIHAIEAYRAGGTGAGVKVAVLDSGLTDALGEFSGRIDAASRDMAGNRGMSDEDGHGTSIGAVIGAARNSNEIHGIAFEATLMVLRTDDPGSCAGNDGCSHYDDVLARALNHARTNGARIANFSLGGEGMSSDLRAAVGRATAAGMIIVISAGNDSAASPDSFALDGIASGNGLVIVAGAYDGGGALADFTNKAGSASKHYLAALGVNVRAFDHEGTAYLYSGTSYAAPVISGAAALIADAFPNLTATQIVDLLYNTADDAGAAGVDAMFGRGIINLTRAFQPQGATSLAGSAIAVSTGQSSTLSSAMGDAAPATGAAVMLDRYQRAFTIDLGATITRPAVRRALNGAIGMPVQSHGLALDGLRTDFSFVRPALAGQFGRMRDGTIELRLDASARATLAFNRAIDPAPTAGGWLIGDNPTSLRAIGARPETGFGLSHNIGDVTLGAFAQQGSFAPTRTDERTSPYHLLSLDARRAFGPVGVGVTLGMMRERNTLLGARLHPALGGGRGATSLLADLDLAYRIGNGWAVRGQWRSAFTEAEAGSLASSAFALDLSRDLARERYGLRLAQPLRVASSRYRLNLPTGYSYATSTASYSAVDLDLAPSGRELDIEANYGRALWGGWIDANLYLRRQPGHIADAPTDKGAALRASFTF